MFWRKSRPWNNLGADTTLRIIAENVDLAGQLDPALSQHHLGLTQLLVAEKRWEAAAGFELTAEMVVTIAANASIPILGLDVWVYRMVKGIIVHPSTTVSSGLRSGPGAGTVRDEPMAVVGVATPFQSCHSRAAGVHRTLDGD